MRLFLTEAGYEKALENQGNQYIHIRNHARVIAGNLKYDHTDKDLWFAFLQHSKEATIYYFDSRPFKISNTNFHALGLIHHNIHRKNTLFWEDISHQCNLQIAFVQCAEIYVDGCNNPGFFPKAVLHDFLRTNPNSIKVNISPYPYVVPATSYRGEKYVRSEANDTIHDNLLKLPRM